MGIALGLAGAAGATRAVASLLYDVSPTDPATYAVIAAVLLLVAAGACWIPARRAVSVDPAVALTSEYAGAAIDARLQPTARRSRHCAAADTHAGETATQESSRRPTARTVM